MISELDEKTGRLKKMLTGENLGGVLLNAQHNFAWLTGGRSSGIDISREGGACFLFVTGNGRRYVISNNIEQPRLLTEEISSEDFEPIEISWQAEKGPETIITRARSLTDGEIAIDTPFNSKLRSIEPLVAGCRYELTSPEIERYRELGRDAGNAINGIVSKISPGQTENEVARIVRDELAACGIFPVVTLIGADERIDKYRHPVPTDNTWKKTLLIVICARRYGLIASLSRMICSGDIPSDLERKTEATAKVNATLYDATVPGAKASELYRIAAAAYAELGLADEIDKHHQGGACGYRTRDWVAHPASSETVWAAQAFAWNPSITGTKTEETAIVTEQGLEVVTTTDSFPKIATVIAGREYFSPGILSLSKGATA